MRHLFGIDLPDLLLKLRPFRQQLLPMQRQFLLPQQHCHGLRLLPLALRFLRVCDRLPDLQPQQLPVWHYVYCLQWNFLLRWRNCHSMLLLRFCLH